MPSANDTIQLSMKPFQDLYQAKEWSKALQWLDEHQKELGNGLTNYNKGVVALKMNQLPLARYYFEQSKLQGFNNPGVYKNIEFIRNDLGLVNVESRSFYENIKSKIFSNISSDVIVLIFLFVLLITLSYWAKFKMKKNIYVLGSILLIATVLLSTNVYKTLAEKNFVTSNEAVILQEQSVYEGPSAIFEALGKVPAGLKVKWDQKGNGWAKISIPVEFTGWIKLDNTTVKEL